LSRNAAEFQTQIGVKKQAERRQRAERYDTRLDMTMYYAYSRKKQRLEAQGRVLEAVLGGERGLQRGPEAVQ